jgi:2-aminoadipate transaminase
MNHDSLFSRVGLGMQQSAIRQMGTVAAQNPDVISFAPGYPAPENLPWDELRAIADDVLAARGRSTLQYGPTRGLPELLDAIVTILGSRGIAATGDELMVTTGSQQGLDLIARVFLDPGDVVLVELPSYTGAITAFRNVQASLVGVRQQPDGIDLDDLERRINEVRREGRRLKFLYLVPNFQNPTGLLISLEKRRRLLELAARHDILIVEDDPYGALYFEDTARAEDTRPLKADDRDGRVVYLSSFSKTLAPAFRVAWVTAPSDLITRFETAKQCLDLCTSDFNQCLVLESIRRGVIDRQVPRLRRYYQTCRMAMETALRDRLGGVPAWIRPRGGFFLWISLPAAIHTGRLLERAMRHGVIYVAGAAFFVDGTGTNTMRLAFCLASPDRIVEGVSRLAAAVGEEVAAGGEASLEAALAQAAAGQ